MGTSSACTHLNGNSTAVLESRGRRSRCFGGLVFLLHLRRDEAAFAQRARRRSLHCLLGREEAVGGVGYSPGTCSGLGSTAESMR